MAEEEGKQEGKGFTVQDRRRFSPETGEARTEASEQSHGTSEAEPQSGPKVDRAGDAAQTSPPEIDFSTFVIGLSTQALMNLGEFANPITGNVESDVAVAKQMIDILGMLKEKTTGNLSASENRLIEDILFDLRMKYVDAVKKR